MCCAHIQYRSLPVVLRWSKLCSLTYLFETAWLRKNTSNELPPLNCFRSWSSSFSWKLLPLSFLSLVSVFFTSNQIHNSFLRAIAWVSVYASYIGDGKHILWCTYCRVSPRKLVRGGSKNCIFFNTSTSDCDCLGYLSQLVKKKKKKYFFFKIYDVIDQSITNTDPNAINLTINVDGSWNNRFSHYICGFY